MSLRVSDGIGSGTPGRLTPLCDVMRPPITTAQRARPFSTSSTRRRTRPSSISTSWPGCQHVADHRGRDRQLAVGRELLRADRDRLAAREDDRLVERADAQLRPLQVGDQRDRTAGLGLDLADPLRALRVILVRPVREVESRGVHARSDERPQLVGRVGCWSERRDDLRSALRGPRRPG